MRWRRRQACQNANVGRFAALLGALVVGVRATPEFAHRSLHRSLRAAVQATRSRLSAGENHINMGDHIKTGTRMVHVAGTRPWAPTTARQGTWMGFATHYIPSRVCVLYKRRHPYVCV